MSSAELPAPQIGRILIAAGLLTEAQLEQALEEQARTSRKLGEIVVSRGFISGPALANALAEQHGGVLKTEYGYASGLGGDVAKRAAADGGDETIPRLRTVEPVPAAAPAPAPAQPEPEPEPPIEAEPEPQAEAEPVPEPPPEPEPVVEPAPAPPEEAPEQPLPPAAEEPAEKPADPPPAEPPARDARDEALEILRARLEAQEAELIALREALESARKESEPEPEPGPQVAEEQALEPAPSAPAPAAGAAEHYLLCVPTDAGYVLLDRHGFVPNVGEDVDVPEEEGRFAVAKVVRLPRNGRACAYLQRDPRAV